MSKGRHVFDVLQNHFEKSAARHIRFGKRAKAASDHLRKCFTKAEMDEDDTPYSAICDLLDELVGEYADAAASAIESCEECMKAESDELDKTMRVRAAVPAFVVDDAFRSIIELDERDSDQWRV